MVASVNHVVRQQKKKWLSSLAIQTNKYSSSYIVWMNVPIFHLYNIHKFKRLCIWWCTIVVGTMENHWFTVCIVNILNVVVTSINILFVLFLFEAFWIKYLHLTAPQYILSIERRNPGSIAINTYYHHHHPYTINS